MLDIQLPNVIHGDTIGVLKGKGLAVANMPTGSPGMEFKNRQDPYEVFEVSKKGKATVFAKYPKAKSPKAKN